ncbi:MAG: VWA domain-containing protein, partial [FCB group bacterium]
MKKFFLFTILLFTSIISTQLYTQTKSAAESAQIFIIFFDDYPCLRATYAVWDTSGNDMRVNNANDIIITEGGKIRTQCANSPYCSPPGNKSFSAIICVDMSISMLDPISTTDGTSRESAALSAIRSFVLALPYNTNANGKHQLQNCEVAIMQFDGGAELITGFTDQQDSLVKMTSPNNYTTRVFTDYNAAFFKDKWGNKTNTALDIAKSARYKPVIIFITDGGHDANYATPADGSEPRDGRVLLDSISYTCHSRRPTVYVFVFQIGNENLDAISKGYLSGLAGIEVGTYNGQPIKNLYLTMTDTSVISNIFANYIPAVCGTVGYPEPCEVLWKSDCMGGGDLKLNFPAYNNVSASYTFTIPDNVKPNLDVNVSSIIFKNVKAIGNYDTTIVITARQDTLDIYNPAFSSTDTRYSIISWGVKTPPFTLRKGESTTITLRYSPTDTLPSSATIKFLGSQCSGGELLCQAQAIKPPTLAADSVRIINLFFDSYPCIGATFAIIDSSGNTVKISNINDIVVKENDSVMTLCDNTPICPDSCVSVIFDIDMSLSMLDPISSTDGTTREAVVLELLRNYILALPTYTDANGKKILQNCEVAIMQFDGSGEIITGFTDNQDSLVKMSASSNFHTRVFTDYNAAFIKDKWGDSTHSALWIAKSARCKPVIVFITDGGHDANYAVPPDGSEPKDGRVLISD